MEISDERLNQLITGEKIITKKPSKTFVENNGCRRNGFLAQSTNGDKFKIFMRQNLLLLEDFSIGLIWKAPEQNDIILCRFNGPHGGNKKIETHFVTHIHKLNLTLANNDIFKENDVAETTLYSTFSEAIYEFCEYCNIVDAHKYFPDCYSQPLF